MATIFDILRGREPGREDEIKRRADEFRMRMDPTGEAPEEAGLVEEDWTEYTPAGITKKGFIRRMMGKKPPSKPGVKVKTGEKGQKIYTYGEGPPPEGPTLDYDKIRQADLAKKRAKPASVTRYEKKPGESETEVTNRLLRPDEER